MSNIKDELALELLNKAIELIFTVDETEFESTATTHGGLKVDIKISVTDEEGK